MLFINYSKFPNNYRPFENLASLMAHFGSTSTITTIGKILSANSSNMKIFLAYLLLSYHLESVPNTQGVFAREIKLFYLRILKSFVTITSWFRHYVCRSRLYSTVNLSVLLSDNLNVNLSEPLCFILRLHYVESIFLISSLKFKFWG